MRILITGSRTWIGPQARWLLEEVLRGGHVLSEKLGEDLIVRHGDCSSGADAMARIWCERNDITQEKRPANWSLGKGAGFERNRDMVLEGGVDLCVGFVNEVDGPSRGTRHCLRHAAEAHIPTRVIAIQQAQQRWAER